MDKNDQHGDALVEAQIALLKGIKLYADHATQGTGPAKPDTLADIAVRLADAYNLITHPRGSGSK